MRSLLGQWGPSRRRGGWQVAGRAVALGADAVGLPASITVRALGWPRLPGAAAAAVTLVDAQPRLRRLVEQRVGPESADVVRAVAIAAARGPTSVAVDLALRAAVVAEPWPRLHAARVWDRSEGPRAASAHLRRASLIAAWSAAGSGFLGRPWTRTVPHPGRGGCGPPPRPGERRVSVRPGISRGRGNRRATHAGVRQRAYQIGSKRAAGFIGAPLTGLGNRPARAMYAPTATADRGPMF